MVKILLGVTLVWTIGYGLGAVIQINVVEKVEQDKRVGFMKTCIKMGGKYDFSKDECNLTKKR